MAAHISAEALDIALTGQAHECRREGPQAAPTGGQVTSRCRARLRAYCAEIGSFPHPAFIRIHANPKDLLRVTDITDKRPPGLMSALSVSAVGSFLFMTPQPILLGSRCRPSPCGPAFSPSSRKASRDRPGVAGQHVRCPCP